MTIEALDRPRNATKRRRILEAALKVFSEQGYSAASMEAIAAQAKVSKPTLYVYFGDKRQLFESMLLTPRAAMLQAFEHPSGNMVKDLHDFAQAYAKTVLLPELLSLARLIIAEAQRFPDIGRAYQQAGPDRVLKGIMDYLNEQRGKGLLDFKDAELAAQDFWALILSAPRNRALHMPDDVPKPSDVRRYLENGLRVFLKAYSQKADVHLAQLAQLTQSQGHLK